MADGVRDGDPSPQQTADLVRDGMLRNDRATRMLGMQVTEIRPGSATLTMTVREEMLNGHDTCHGGLISTLADSAFAFAVQKRHNVRHIPQPIRDASGHGRCAA